MSALRSKLSEAEAAISALQLEAEATAKKLVSEKEVAVKTVREELVRPRLLSPTPFCSTFSFEAGRDMILSTARSRLSA